MRLDTVISGGAVIDGTGGRRYMADVGIRQGRIAAIGRLAAAEADAKIDASRHIVAPGFIDLHSHSDVTLLDDPGAESKVHQGVTTEVIGNCGFSPFPAGPAAFDALRRSHASPLRWDWSGVAEWADRLEANGTSINVVPQVGHSALRVAAGVTEDRPPTGDELRAMRRLAAEAVEQEAYSLSTGLTLAPSCYAATEEIVALVEAIAAYPGVFYVTHARLWAGNHIRAVEEAVEIGRRAGVPVQYSHMAIIDSRAYGRGDELVGVIDRARAEGQDVTYDIYPYTAAGTHLSQLVPQWVQEGGVPAMLRRLRDPMDRRRAWEETTRGYFRGLSHRWDKMIISYVGSEGGKELVGRSLAHIAESRGTDPAETLLALIDEEDNQVGAVVHNRVESDVRFFLAHPQAMVASDGNAIAPDGVYRGDRPHPRFYGTFPRVLGRYARGRDAVLSLEEAVAKMTGMPARRLSMSDRGTVAEGAVADLVVFDPETVIDRATFEDLHQYPSGIHHVLVRGEPVVSAGRHTGARPGRVLRRGA